MDERRLLLAALLSAVVIVIWQMAFPPPDLPAPAPPPTPSEATSSPAEPLPPEPIAEPVSAPAPELEASALEEAEVERVELVAAEIEERVSVETARFRAVWTNRGAQLRSFVLFDHEESEDRPLELVRDRPSDEAYPFALVGADLEPLAVNAALFRVEREKTEATEVLRFTYRGPLGSVEKVFRFGPQALFEVDVTVEQSGEWGVVWGPGLRNPALAEAKNRYAVRTGVYQQGDELETLTVRKADERVVADGVRWAGLNDTYFLSVLVPEIGGERAVFQPVLEARSEEGEVTGFIDLEPERELSKAEKAMVREYRVALLTRGDHLVAQAFWEAKTYDELEALPYGLEKTVTWGFFGFISRPLLKVLLWIHDQVVPNYGWAIVLTTLLLKLVLLPVTHWSHVEMKKMQQLSPKMQAIRQKYRGKVKDKKGGFNAEAQRKMNEEMQALYKEEGVHPASGCLPMLLQIPVFFAFFRLLPTAVELRRAPWILWIADLSAPDPFLILPVLMGASQFLQQRLTPQAGDPMQRRIMQLFPVVFTVFSFGFPSGLVLYWSVNNLVTMAQIAGYNKLKERSAAGSRSAKRKG